MLLFPWLAWIAAGTSLVLLVALRIFGEMRPGSFAPLVGAFLVAAYGQFISSSDLMNKVGLVLQTILAVYLVVRFKLGR